MINEGGNEGWERFRKRQGKTLKKILNKMRKQEKNKALQFRTFGNKKVAKDAVRARESFQMEAKMTSKESLNNWEHQDAVKVADMMIKEYGQPDEVTETMIKWKKLGDFGSGEQETYIIDESIPHDFPEPHRDFLYTSKKIKVPTKVGDTLLHVTGSIIVDGLKETVTARCGSLNANALTLGFVEDLAKGKVVNNKGVAKREYAKRIKEGPLPSWYTDKLKKHMPKDQQEQNHMCGCLMTEADGCWDGYKKEGMKKKGKKVVPNCVPEGIGAAYMPQAGKKGVPEREITSKAVKKQLNRNRNRATMKGDLETPHVRYVHSRDKSTDYIRPEKKKRRFKKKSVKENTSNIIAFPIVRRKPLLNDKEKQKKESFGDRGLSLQELGDPAKMNQLFRMGLAKKGELQLMQRMMKRGPDALKDPKLRQKMYDLLVDLTDLVTKDGQTFVKVRQNVQKNKKDLQAVKEFLYYGGQQILEVNAAYELINIDEDMSGMSVSSGHKRSKDSGAGMTKKGVNAYKRRNPGSKLQTAVTTPPSKLKAGSKAAGRRKSFCARSRSWTGERGKAARKRWNC